MVALGQGLAEVHDAGANRGPGDAREVAAGDVILLHDADFYSARGSYLQTAKALPAIIKELKRLGLDTVLPV